MEPVLKYLVFLFPLFLRSQAFWWARTATTEAPPPPTVMKQIPLTYFRTYTYQQPIGSHQLPLPLLSSTDYIANQQALSTAPYFNPMMHLMPMLPLPLAPSNEISLDVRPAKSYASVNLVRSFNNILPPPTIATSEPTTTTSTSTTTTPAPTTTTTTTTTTEASTTVEEIPITVRPLIKTDSAYPAFNRKVFTNNFNINYNRPVYPSPEYNTYNSNLEDTSAGVPNVEFVPCMCPINIASSGYPQAFQGSSHIFGQPTNSIFLAQGRTNSDADSPYLDEPIQQHTQVNMGLKAQAEVTNLVNDLHKLESEQQDLKDSENV